MTVNSILNNGDSLLLPYTWLFEMTDGNLTTCHTQYTWDRSICTFLFNRTTLQVCYIPCAPFVILQTQHDNPVRSKLFVACQRWWFQWWLWFVPSVPVQLREEEEHKPDPWRNNCNWPTFMKCKHTKRLLTAIRRHHSELRSKRRNA